MDHQLRSLSRNLRRCRIEARFTQGALARAVGVGQTAISQWEQGVVIPTLPNLLRVMEVLSCEPNELFALVPDDELVTVASEPSST